jgi:hypothetical protein
MKPVNLRGLVSGGSAMASLVLAVFACGGGTLATPDAGTSDAAPVATDRCAVITRSIQEAGFAAKVTVTCDARYANVASDTYPEHAKMDGITGTNDQVPVPAPGYVSPIPLAPVRAASPTTIDAALGVAVNGVPIYDYSSQGMNDIYTYDPKADTKLTGELDVCNAKADGTFGARYHTSDAPPYVFQCLVGQVDLARAPRVAPLTQPNGMGKPPGSKPPGGVTNLHLAEASDGTRTMTYDWSGKTYSIAYKPSATPGCWDFVETSFTTGGVAVRSTYCRKS